jgi:hypothetical protein
MYHSDLQLECAIANYERTLSLLKELQERRVKGARFSLRPKHKELYRREDVKGRITEVTCTCGEKVKYKKPLNSISDFKCPKERN